LDCMNASRAALLSPTLIPPRSKPGSCLMILGCLLITGHPLLSKMETSWVTKFSTSQLWQIGRVMIAYESHHPAASCRSNRRTRKREEYRVRRTIREHTPFHGARKLTLISLRFQALPSVNHRIITKGDLPESSSESLAGSIGNSRRLKDSSFNLHHSWINVDIPRLDLGELLVLELGSPGHDYESAPA